MASPSYLETAFLDALNARYPSLALSVIHDKTFAPPRKWRADFRWEEARLIVEIDGLYGNSRHRSVTGFHNDICKLNAACMLGYHVLRFTSRHINADVEGCVEMVARVIQSRYPVLAPISDLVEK